MSRPRPPLLFVLLLVSIGVIGAILPASSQQRELFEEQIGVEIINIDVVVNDKKGRAVTGLTEDDFELRIDGQQVPIANFYALTDPSARRGAARASIEEIPAPEAEAVAETDAETPLHLIAYIESFYLTPISRKRVLAELPGFFEEQIAAGARIMLVTHDQTSRVLTSFTRDLAELRAALETIQDSPAVGLRQQASERQVIDNVSQIFQHCEDNPFLNPCTDCLSQMVEMARIHSQALLSERRGAMAALGNVVNALAVLEGRKALLHVSDGIQQQSGISAFYYLGEQLCPQKRQEFQEYYLRQEVDDLNDLVNQANASRVTFYTLESAGPRNFSSASADWADARFKPDATNDMVRIGNLQSTLHYLADETGGKAILNTTQFASDLAKLSDEVQTYYSLGYQPAHIGGGRPHRVGVKVPANRSYQVRYRRSFVHKKPDQRLADRVLGAVMFGVAENPLAAGVVVVPREAVAEGAGVDGDSVDRDSVDGDSVVSLEVSVPVDQLTLIQQEGARHGRLAAIVAAPDEKGKKTVIRRKQIDVLLAPEDGEESGASEVYRFGINVELAPGEHQLGVGIWDEIASQGSFLSLVVKVSGS